MSTPMNVSRIAAAIGNPSHADGTPTTAGERRFDGLIQMRAALVKS